MTTKTRSTAQVEYPEAVIEAVAMYLRRQARVEHPAGKFDKGGRFYLSEVCGRECSIRPPSRAYPYSQMVHGRSLVHCAHALGASRTEAARLLREIQKRTIEPPTIESVIAGVDDDADSLVNRLARLFVERPAQAPEEG